MMKMMMKMIMDEDDKTEVVEQDGKKWMKTGEDEDGSNPEVTRRCMIWMGVLSIYLSLSLSLPSSLPLSPLFRLLQISLST